MSGYVADPKTAAARKRAAPMFYALIAGASLKEIGESYGVTDERVRQLITRHFRDEYKRFREHTPLRLPDRLISKKGK